MKKVVLALLCLLSLQMAQAQSVKGKVTDPTTGAGVPSASLVWKGGSTLTDTAGFFSIDLKGASSVTITAVDYIEQTLRYDGSSFWTISLESLAKNVGLVKISHNRLKEKLRESPVTVESLNAKAIKETPASDFYEGLGHLRGVDVTAASLGFRIVNTRGFNSTSPVRSLQLIDGVDNQAPGLNFSLGNFLGASELDVANTEIVVGASSAY